jgi:hypothetical protein
MALVTGSNGELRFNGIRVGKCRDFSVELSRETLETTTLGSFDRTFVPGIRSATGSATIIYDSDDSGTTNLLNSLLANSDATSRVQFVLDTAASKILEIDAFLTQVSTPVSVGAVTACSVSFQATGTVEGSF